MFSPGGNFEDQLQRKQEMETWIFATLQSLCSHSPNTTVPPCHPATTVQSENCHSPTTVQTGRKLTDLDLETRVCLFGFPFSFFLLCQFFSHFLLSTNFAETGTEDLILVVINGGLFILKLYTKMLSF